MKHQGFLPKWRKFLPLLFFQEICLYRSTQKLQSPIMTPRIVTSRPKLSPHNMNGGCWIGPIILWCVISSLNIKAVPPTRKSKKSARRSFTIPGSARRPVKIQQILIPKNALAHICIWQVQLHFRKKWRSSLLCQMSEYP